MDTMNDQVRCIYITRQYKFRDAHIYSRVSRTEFQELLSRSPYLCETILFLMSRNQNTVYRDVLYGNVLSLLDL